MHPIWIRERRLGRGVALLLPVHSLDRLPMLADPKIKADFWSLIDQKSALIN